MGLTIREFVTRWGFDVDFAKLDELETSTKRLQMNFLKVGAAASAALAAQIIPAANLDTEVRKAAAITGKTGTEFTDMLGGLTDQAIKFSDELGVAATDVADGFYQVISTGAQPLTESFDDLTKSALRLKKTVGTDVGDNVKDLTTIMANFSKEELTASQIGDKLFKTSAATKAEVPDLAEAMRIAGPAAESLGISLNDTLAILGGFAEKGFTRGALAGETFKQSLGKVYSATGDARDVLNSLGVATADSSGKFLPVMQVLDNLRTALSKTSDEAQLFALKDLVGEESWTKLKALLSVSSETLRGFSGDIAKSDGALKIASEQMDGTANKTKKLWEQIKNLSIRFGGPLQEPLQKFADLLMVVTGNLGQFLDKHPELTRFVSLLTGGTLAAVALGSGLLFLKGMLDLAAVAWTRYAVAEKMAFVGGAAKFLGVFLMLFLLFDDFAAMLAGNRSVIGDFFDGIESDFKPALQMLTGALVVIAGIAAFVFSPVALLVALLATLSALVIRNWDSFKLFFKFLREDFGALVDWFEGKAKKLVEWIDKISNPFKKWGDEAPKELSATVNKAFNFFGIRTGRLNPPASVKSEGLPGITSPTKITSTKVEVGGITVSGANSPKETADEVELRLKNLVLDAQDDLLGAQ